VKTPLRHITMNTADRLIPVPASVVTGATMFTRDRFVGAGLRT